MKSPIIVSVFLITLALGSVRGDEPKSTKLHVLDTDTDGGDHHTQRRVIIRHDNDEGEMETVPFLGVETIRVGTVLAAQLNLPKGTGLIIRDVVANSPAANVLQANDVLTKIDDQLLIEGRQLSVLVRNHKVGDEVALSYIRGGKAATAKVKLGQHEIRKVAEMDFPGDRSQDLFWSVPPGESGRHAEFDHVLGLIEPDRAGGPDLPPRLPFPGKVTKGFRSSKVDLGNSNMMFSDEQGTLELTSKNGTKMLLAKNKTGEQIFSGPVDTPEQREKLPAEIRERLKKLETMEGFEFQGGESGVHEFRVFRPEPTSLDRPLPDLMPVQPEGSNKI